MHICVTKVEQTFGNFMLTISSFIQNVHTHTHTPNAPFVCHDITSKFNFTSIDNFSFIEMKSTVCRRSIGRFSFIRIVNRIECQNSGECVANANAIASCKLENLLHTQVHNG